MARSAIHLLKTAIPVLCLTSFSQLSHAKCGCPIDTQSPMASSEQSHTTSPVKASQTDIEWEKGNNSWDNVPKDNHRIEISKGWKLPNSNTWLTIGGMAKFDAYHDLEASSADPFEAYHISPKSSISSRMNNNTKLIVRQSNINISTISETRVGEIKTFLEGDFAANNYFGGGESTNRHYISLNSICFRLREVYVETSGFLFGQTTTTFSDREAVGYTLIHNGVTGHSALRLPMVRYTWYNPFLVPENGSTRLMIGAEAGTTDYSQYSGFKSFTLPNGVPGSVYAVDQLENDTRVTPRSRGVSPLPNFTAQLRFEKKGLGHIAFRGLARYFTIRPDKTTTIRDMGWGLGVSTRLFVTKSDSIFFNYSAGRGIGYYIFDLPCQSLAYNVETKTHAVQFAQGIILGFEHYWTDHLRSNVIAGVSQVNNARFLKDKMKNVAQIRGGIPAVYDSTSMDAIGIYQNDIAFVNHRIQQVTVNLMYKPTAALEMGVEYTHAKRTTISGQHGIAKRFQVSFMYRF